MTFDLRAAPACTWPEEFAPIGCGNFTVESYPDWEARTGYKLDNICSEIKEQWLHKHWKYSPLSFIPLETIAWREERWPPKQFLADVKLWRGDDELDPAFDFETFVRPGGEKHATAIALDQGEWDFAPPLLSTPDGFINKLGERVHAPYLLIEGHQRRRYLNALVSRGVNLPDQRVFIIDSPIINMTSIKGADE